MSNTQTILNTGTRNSINTIKLGPRARRVVKFAARFVNPLVLLVAGRRWMPVVGCCSSG